MTSFTYSYINDDSEVPFVALNFRVFGKDVSVPSYPKDVYKLFHTNPDGLDLLANLDN